MPTIVADEDESLESDINSVYFVRVCTYDKPL